VKVKHTDAEPAAARENTLRFVQRVIDNICLKKYIAKSEASDDLQHRSVKFSLN